MASFSNHHVFYTEQLNTGLRVAQVLGLTTTAFLSGKAFSQSFSTTPALLHAPAPLLARQWQTMFGSDRALAPAAVLLGSGVFGYLAYRGPHASRPAMLYATSAALLLACIPYSALLLEPVNQELEKKARELASASLTGAAAKDESVHMLVDRWATVNLGRAVLSGLAALLATWAAVNRAEVVPAVVRFASGADRLR